MRRAKIVYLILAALIGVSLLSSDVFARYQKGQGDAEPLKAYPEAKSTPNQDGRGSSKTIRHNTESIILGADTMVELDQVQEAISHHGASINTREGFLQASVIDDYASSRTLYILITEEGKRIIIHPTKEIDDSFVGAQVRVTGYELQENMIIDLAESKGLELIKLGEPDIAIQSFPLEVNTLIVLAYFQDLAQPDVPKEKILEQFNMTGAYYEENSYGKILYRGVVATNQAADILDWVQIPIDSSDLARACDIGYTRYLTRIAVDPLVNFTNYQRVMYVLPFRCGWAGVGNKKQECQNTEDGLFCPYDTWLAEYAASEEEYIISHEQGHNFNLEHAAFYDCGNTAYADENCTVLEYGDRYAIMGATFPKSRHMSSIYKDQLNLFDSGNILEVTGTSVQAFTLEPLEAVSNNLKVLKMPRGDLGKYMYIEYRQPIGFDEGLEKDYYFDYDTNVYTGGIIHMQKNTSGASPQSFLVDATPSGEYHTSALAPGNSFIDPQTGTKITAISQDPTGFTVEVEPGPTNNPPTVNINVPPGNLSGTVTITASASDDDGTIDRVEFFASGYPRGPFAIDGTSPYEVGLNTTQLSNGALDIWAVAYDDIGVSTASGKSSATIDNPDTTPPSSAVIERPLDGSLINNPVAFTVSAVDDVGIAKIEVFIDFTNRPYWTSDYPGDSTTYYVYRNDGLHDMYAIVYDVAGNQITSNTITFEIDHTSPIVSWVGPLPNTYISGNRVLLEASATDSHLDRVEFYHDNDSLIGTDFTEPFSLIFNSKSISNGRHTFYVKAIDQLGNESKSTPVTLIVNNPYKHPNIREEE